MKSAWYFEFLASNYNMSSKKGIQILCSRATYSEIGYGVHPDQIEVPVWVIFLQTASVSILDRGKKMSLSQEHVWLRYK